MSVPSTVDSPDALSSLQAHLGTFDRETLHRGQAYFRSGRVGAVKRFDDNTVTAEVRGSRLYRTELRREETDWQNSCTCPMSRDCKHVAALGAHWMGKLAAAKRAAAPAFRPTVAAGSPVWHRGAFRAEWEPVLVKKLGRALTSDEGVFLNKLSQLFHNFQLSGRVSSVDIARLGFATNESKRAPYESAYAGWLPEPPRDPLELWQCIAYDLESSSLSVPEFMRPITDTTAVRDYLQNRQRGESIKRWNDRFDRLLAAPAAAPASAAAGLVLPPGFELRLSLAPGRWSLETRTRPEAPWKPAPKALLDRITRDPAGGLTTLDASPAVFAFLAVCHEHHRRTYSFALNPGTQGSRELLHRLLSHRLARTLVVGVDGQPLEFSEAPLAWELQRSATSPQDYEIALRLPDGQPFPPAALHLPGRPDLYLHGSIVYPGPPALDGASATAAIVPAEVIERPEVLKTLRQYQARLPAEIEARFVNVPLHARVTCTLGMDALENEILTLQLFAVADKPAMLRVWMPGGWSAVAKGPADPAAGKDKVYTFDFSAADEAAGRLDELGVAFDSHHQSWIRRVTKTFPDEFIEWREALPPGTEVVATGELASLLSAPIRARVEFDINEAAHRDWFDLALALKPEDSTLTKAEIALLLKARGKLVRLPGKGWRRLTVELDGPPASALEAAGFDVGSIGEAALSGEKHRFHALQLAQTSVVDLLPDKQANALRDRAHELSRPVAPPLPEGLRAELRPYQREGFEFLAFLSANGLGGVLADDMGLGKTLQALTWLLWLSNSQPKGEPLLTLVVCPKSVVGNWEAETARFAPSLGVLRFAPTYTARELSRRAGQPTIVVANYTQLRLNADFFRKQAWHAVILDEAQFIKNPASKVAQLARELPGQHRLVLTGTPIENRLLDLWSLFAFALPGLLGTQAAFKRHYSQDNPLALARLRTRVRHFLLRRTKRQVAADLPPRTEEDIVIELEGEQDRLYQAELKHARAQLLRVETPRQLDKARFNILASLMRLRQICCHPALIDGAQRDTPSAKLEELMERVEELRDEGHQVLVFSQFVEMLHIIRDRMTTAGIDHLLLTGQTDNREELIAQFQADRSKTVFLLSLKAAGFGLNLTAASYVILYDPWWNPAVEAQAIDRAHRIGQSNPVNAYRFIARGTVEEKIRVLQRDKAALANAVVQEDSLASVLDLETLKHVLS